LSSNLPFDIHDFLQVSAYFDIILDRIECSADTDFMECSSLKVKRVQKQRLMFGNVSIFTPLDNNVIIQLIPYKKQGGEYRKMPYKINEPFCDVVQRDEYFYDDLCANSTFLKDRPCPYPAGTYIFNGYTASLANLPKVIIPSGDYRLHFSMKVDSKVKFLAVFTVSIIQL
jgi:Protein of unknown function (DUF1091)